MLLNPTYRMEKSELAKQAMYKIGGNWQAIAVYDQAADWLQHALAASDPPPLIEHAQQAGRFAAIAIGALDRDAPNVPEAIADCLAHLLTVCVFADAAGKARVASDRS